MTSHELANELLQLPNMEIAILKTDKKNELIPVIGTQVFEGGAKADLAQIGILSRGQKVSGNLYWHGSVPYVPKGIRANSNNLKRPFRN